MEELIKQIGEILTRLQDWRINDKLTVDELRKAITLLDKLSSQLAPPVIPKIAEGWHKEKPNHPCKFVTKTKDAKYIVYGLYEMEIEEGRLILHDNLIDEWIEIKELNADEYLLLEKND